MAIAVDPATSRDSYFGLCKVQKIHIPASAECSRVKLQVSQQAVTCYRIQRRIGDFSFSAILGTVLFVLRLHCYNYYDCFRILFLTYSILCFWKRSQLRVSLRRRLKLSVKLRKRLELVDESSLPWNGTLESPSLMDAKNQAL